MIIFTFPRNVRNNAREIRDNSYIRACSALQHLHMTHIGDNNSIMIRIQEEKLVLNLLIFGSTLQDAPLPSKVKAANLRKIGVFPVQMYEPSTTAKHPSNSNGKNRSASKLHCTHPHLLQHMRLPIAQRNTNKRAVGEAPRQRSTTLSARA